MFDGRWHVKNATRCRLLRPPSFRHFYVGIVLRHHRLQGLVKDIWCLCRKSRPRKSCGRVHLPFFSRQSSTSSSTSSLQPSFLPTSPLIFYTAAPFPTLEYPQEPLRRWGRPVKLWKLFKFHPSITISKTHEPNSSKAPHTEIKQKDKEAAE